MHVEIRELRKSFGGFPALQDVSFEIPPGQIVAVLGPSGAGKTSLLRCLAGLIAADKGGVFYDGELFHRGRLDLRKRFCFLPEFPVLHPEMTAIAHIGIALRLYRAPNNWLKGRGRDGGRAAECAGE